MKITLTKFLILILFIILLFDILILYLYKANKLELFKYFNKSRSGSEKNIEFSTDFSSALKTGEIRLQSPRKDDPAAASLALFRAYVEDGAFFDNKSKNYILPILIEGKRKNIKANLVLGVSDHIISMRFGKRDEQTLFSKESNTLKVKNLINSFKVNQLLAVQIYYQQNVEEVKKLSECDKFCEQKLYEYEKYFANAENIFKNLDTDKPVTENVFIGPLTTIVIYDN